MAIPARLPHAQSVKPGAHTSVIRAGLIVALVVAAATASTVVAPGNAAARPPDFTATRPGDSSSVVFGVLNARPQYLQTDAAAGIRLAMVNIGWDNWEPERGVMNPYYIQQQLTIVRDYEDAGWEVAVDLGLEFPPTWATQESGDQLVDQSGRPSGTPNFEFSSNVRRNASAFIKDVVKTLPGIDYYRIGLSELGEMLYPASPNNEWWAFDANAQGRQTGLPVGATVSPMPGWVPGTAQWRGAVVSPTMVESWYQWYLGALVRAERWEIATIRRSGYTGELQYVVPGTGVLPGFYQAQLANRLSPVAWDPYHSMNTGSVWWRVLRALPASHAVVDISSVGDGSGSAEDQACQGSDSTVNDLSAPAIGNWSDTRWLAYLARKNGLGVIGENPGSVGEQSPEDIMALVRSCGLTALQWAWDTSLNEGTGTTSFAAYKSAIGT